MLSRFLPLPNMHRNHKAGLTFENYNLGQPLKIVIDGPDLQKVKLRDMTFIGITKAVAVDEEIVVNGAISGNTE